MASSDEDDYLKREKARWEQQTLAPALSRLRERKPAFHNTSN
jgi:hypothetical protein